MIKCSECDSEIPDDAKFCRNCGAEIIHEGGGDVNQINICPSCGSEIAENSKFCANCGAETTVVEVNKTKFCPKCGFKMDDGLNFCPNCENSTNVVSAVRSDKSPALAAILSFFIVGLGQIYLGLTKKGILLLVGAIISGVLMLIFIGWILWLIIWIYSIYDAYISAQKINSGIVVEDTIGLKN